MNNSLRADVNWAVCTLLLNPAPGKPTFVLKKSTIHEAAFIVSQSSGVHLGQYLLPTGSWSPIMAFHTTFHLKHLSKMELGTFAQQVCAHTFSTPTEFANRGPFAMGIPPSLISSFGDVRTKASHTLSSILLQP